MSGTILLATMLGWALVPFMLSVVYGCTGAGKKRVSPMMDVLAVAVGIIAFIAVSSTLRGMLVPSIGHWGALAGAIAGQGGLALSITLTYKILYAGKPKASAHH